MNNTDPELYIKEIDSILQGITCRDKLTFIGWFGYETINDKNKRIAYLYKNAGNIYKINNLSKSLECYVNSIRYFNKFKEDWANLCANFNNQEENQYGREYDINKDIAECYINAGLLSTQLKMNNEAIDFYIKGSEIYKKINFINKLDKYYENIGDLYLLELMFNNSLKYFNMIIELLDKNDFENAQTMQKRINITYKLSLIYIKYFNNFEKTFDININLLNIFKKNSGILTGINYKKYLYYISLLYIIQKNYYKLNEFMNHMKVEYFNGVNKDIIIISNLINDNSSNSNSYKEIMSDDKNDELIKLLVTKIYLFNI